ncbi:MAG TPA: response regulator [Opitutaceae bacterium]|jgi:DNA-binding NarL/FixJ family response regulator|nr:response regulator [Opitutaceae bacterium]
MPRPVNALIVDDEPHVRVLIKMLLKQLGIETIWEAPDGNAALDQANAHKPDVILLDINLPQIGGLEVLARLKAAHPKIPVIIVSSQSTMKTVIQTRELGAEAYVLKHAPKSEVLQMLSDAFDNIAEADSELPGPTDGELPAAPA